MDRRHLLDDAAMAQFLVDGFIDLDPGVDESVHEALFTGARGLHDEGRAIGGDSNHIQVMGDNLRARIPTVDQVLEAPPIHGALTSLLGPDYVLHPHNFVHESSLRDQSFHQDGNLPWNDRGHYRSHKPNWVVLFYYPQEVRLPLGPTEVLPGSQYWTTDFEKSDGTWHRGDAVVKNADPDDFSQDDLTARDRRIQEVVDSLGIASVARRKLELPRGRVVLAHYDIFHRGTRRAPESDARRFMYKFYYFRTQDPEGPSWRHERAPAVLDKSPMAAEIWRWLGGRGAIEPTAEVALTDLGAADEEDTRTRAAYALGIRARQDAALCGELGELLFEPRESLRRAAAYALGLAGDNAEGPIVTALNAPAATTRRLAAAAAGEARLGSVDAVDALFACLETDPDDLVRSNAAYSLGSISRTSPQLVDPLRLIASLDPDKQPDNTENGLMSRSTVRESVAYALTNRSLPEDALEALSTVGLQDHDRYVVGLTVEILRRHASSDRWVVSMLDHLVRQRFNVRPPRTAAEV